MTIQDIKSIAPAIFSTSADPKMSNKYSFVPTIELMENFTNEGWELSSVRQNGKGIYGVHEIRFRNGELPAVGDTLVEAIVRNSHNGMTTLNVGAGLFRLVCSNGLTVATSTAEQFNIRHTGFNPDDVKSFKMPKGSIIVYNTHGIHRAKPSNSSNFVRKSLFFQVDGNDNSEPLLINPSFMTEFDERIRMYLGFGRKSSNTPFPHTDETTIPDFEVQNLISKIGYSRVKSMIG